MELGTAGSILSYALDLEAKATEFYQKSIEGNISADVKEAFEENNQRHRKIAKTLDRMRKENVTEMILEPVHDFESDDFVIEITHIQSTVVVAKKIEQTILEYLRASAEKVAFLPQMKEMLEDLASRIMKNSNALNNLGSE
ncbi:hypothetical protein EU527_13015 [Candidatus Thorarchaeota archaeon]|nr:MAG: hypothetical protein EU527_13015 [Candidatus Thorarchaeota archaeon]